jgi:ATP-dependent phosphofructokinase / diphosphate-dependent phosphofructokinase
VQQKKRVLLATGGGDCPGLNAVIRAVVKRMSFEPDWEVLGSIEAFNGILRDPMEIKLLDDDAVAGIHYLGGTIIKTTNKGGPLEWPVQQPDGSWHTEDRVEMLHERLQQLGVEAIISIGGEGSMDIANKLQARGINMIGVPKTIDNDLSSTDVTFGFQTAVEIATEAVDKLVTTAASHNRLMILEVMGRHAGWIGLSAAIAGGADVALIPEIPFEVEQVANKIRTRMAHEGYAIIVISEGAKAKGGDTVSRKSDEVGYANVLYGGVGHQLAEELKAHVKIDTRVTVLGHIQRGGTPVAYDRILASQFGVKAAELLLAGEFGKMVSYRQPDVVSVPIADAVSEYKFVKVDSALVQTARGMGICLGDRDFGPRLGSPAKTTATACGI